MADDDSDDRFLLEYRLRRAGVPNPVLGFRDGEELVSFLARVEADGGRACVLLLDLRMPLIDGFGVLGWLQQRPRFRDLPVAVITSSTLTRDRQRAIDRGVADYSEKFPGEADLARIVSRAAAHPFAL